MADTPYPIPRGKRVTEILSGNGGAVYGPFMFRIFDIDDVEVIVRHLGDASFSPATVAIQKISGVAFDFFTITFPAVLPSTSVYQVRGARVASRSVGVQKGTRLDTDALEREFSKIAVELQEVRRDGDLSIRVPYGALPPSLPEPAENAVIGWKNNQFVNRDPGEFINDAGFATSDQGEKADAADALLLGMSTVTPYMVETRRFQNIGFQSFLHDLPDGQYPAFGPSAVHGRSTAKYHGVIGETVQDGSNGYSFPIGTLGYGRLSSPGNQVFGGFFRADQYSSGVATTEFNTFNYSEDAPANYPWSRGFGITASVPVAITIAAGGDYVSAAAIEIGQEGSHPNSFQFGIALQKKGVKKWSIYQDADAVDGPTSGMYMAIPGDGINLVLRTMKAVQPKNAVLAIVNAAGNERASVRQDGSGNFGTGAGSHLPTRLNVAGSDVIRGVANTSAMFAVDLTAANALGAAVQLASINGNTPAVAGSRYGPGESTASPLVFLTDATERFRFLPAPGVGLGIKTPVPANSYASDAAAGAAGVGVGEWYLNGSTVQVRKV